MEIRALTPEDRPAQRRLMAEAFDGGRRPAADPPTPEDLVRFGQSLRLGAFDGPRLVAVATVHWLPVTWGQSVAVMGGVAGVACAADQRGQGRVARLLAESLRQMRDEGVFLSGLYPFAYAFYRRHGWEWVGERQHFTVPTREIPAYPDVRQVTMHDGTEARELVRPVYAACARRYQGMTTRENAVPDFWKTLDDSEGRITYVHVHRDADTGTPDGYLTFRFHAEDAPAEVFDFFAETPAAYRGLLSVLHYYGTQTEKVLVRGPAGDPLPFHVMHWDLETKTMPLFMGRVVDVSAAFAHLQSPKAEGRVVLRLSDPQCDWNDGIWAVEADGGHVISRRTEEMPGVECDIQALSQAFWGQPSLSLLRSAGRLAVTDERQFQTLSALLPPEICYLPDGF